MQSPIILFFFCNCREFELADFNASYELWRQVAAKLFSDESQARFWVDSELQLFQKQKKIWSEIDPPSQDEFKAGRGISPRQIAEYGTEYLIRWLSDRGNFYAKNWTSVWHYVNERLPFDERVAQIAISWMYALDDEDCDLQQSKTLVFALLQGWVLLGKDFPDYGEFLSDRFASDPSLLFGYLRPRKLFSQLLQYLSIKGNLDDLLKIISFGITNLPKEGYIVEAMRSCLLAIGSQALGDQDRGKTSPLNREFEQRHVETATNLLRALDDASPIKAER